MSIVKAIKALDPYVTTAGVLTPDTYRGLMSELFLAGGQGPVERFIYDQKSSLTAYQLCPPLTAVINKKASAYINGKTWVMDAEGKESKSVFANKLRNRLSKPNPLQTWKQFEAQQQIIVGIAGFCLLFPVMPVGYKDPIDCSSMWNIPPAMLTIEESNKLFYQTDLTGILKKVTLNYKGQETIITDKPFYIFKDFLPSLNSMIIPESRICSLARPISNIMGALESRGVLINYRGALGILSSSNDKFGYIPIKEDQKESLQADFRRYGLRDQQWKFIITSAAVNWQQMGVPTRELMLFEEIEDDTNMICDSYGYPIDLMSGSTRKTYQNAPEAGKALYQNTIIPEADSMYDQWNIFFKTSENKCRLEKDYSHIPVLQEDKVEQGRARMYLNQALLIEWQQNILTVNQWLEFNGMDTLGDEGNAYYSDWVKQGKVFGSSQATLPPNNNNQQV